MRRFLAFTLIIIALILPLTAAAQGGPGTRDFPIRDFGACINLPDFTNEAESLQLLGLQHSPRSSSLL